MKLDKAKIVQEEEVFQSIIEKADKKKAEILSYQEILFKNA